MTFFVLDNYETTSSLEHEFRITQICIPEPQALKMFLSKLSLIHFKMRAMNFALTMLKLFLQGKKIF